MAWVAYAVCKKKRASRFSKCSQQLNLLLALYTTLLWHHWVLSIQVTHVTSFYSWDQAQCTEREREMPRVNCTSECVFLSMCERTTEYECFLFFVQVSSWGEVGYRGKKEKENNCMHYQMFPFRNSTLFSILSLKRMCSRLYPAC